MFEYRSAADGAVVDRLQAAEQQIAALHAEQLDLIVELYRRAPDWITAAAGTPGLVDAADVAAAEIGVALRISRRSAMDRLGLALQLARRLPDTAAALRRGELSLAKARIITEATDNLTDEHTAQVQVRVLPRAGGQTPAGLGASVARAVLAADPDAARRRHAEAVRERTVRFTPGTDGMAGLWARLSAEDALGCYRELCELADTAAAADPAAGDPTADDPAAGGAAGGGAAAVADDRTADARRADTLVDLIMGAATNQQPAQDATGPDDEPAATPAAPPAAPPSADAATPADAADAGAGRWSTNGSVVPRSTDTDVDAAVDAAGAVPAALRRPTPSGSRQDGRRVRIDVTVAWTTLAGLDDQPGYLGGYGPIDAETARELAADATWRRLLTDPATGTVLDVGTTRYTPPAAMAALVRARDRTCRWYGCRQPAARCDLDHTIAHPHGPTASWNLAALCRGHHRLKTHTSWRAHQDRDGVLTWTSPTGQRIATEPWPRDLRPPPDTPAPPKAEKRDNPGPDPPDAQAA